MKPDPIVERLVPDPADVPDVRVLRGFLGSTPRKGYWRLYLRADLSTYAEFRESDVVHSEQFQRDNESLGGTIVWLKREANIQHLHNATREAQADFLQGSMRGCLKHHSPPTGRRPLVAQFVPFSASFHFYSICDQLAAPSFLSGGSVYCGGSFDCSATWDAEC